MTRKQEVQITFILILEGNYYGSVMVKKYDNVYFLKGWRFLFVFFLLLLSSFKPSKENSVSPLLYLKSY